LKGKTADQSEKASQAHGGKKPLTSDEKRIAGSWTADQRGLRGQSPIQARGGGPYWKETKEDVMLENNVLSHLFPW